MSVVFHVSLGMAITDLFRAYFMLLLAVSATGQAYVNFLMEGSNVIGEYGQMKCQVYVNHNYIVKYVSIRTPDMEVSLNFMPAPPPANWMPFNWTFNMRPELRRRIQVWPMFPGIQMSIRPLQCPDQQLYTCSCTFKYKWSGNNAEQIAASSLPILIHVPPHSMSMTIVGASDSIEAEDHWRVSSKNNITAICSGNVDQNKQSIIEWVIYRNGVLEQLADNDCFLKELIYLQIPSEDFSCIQRVQQILSVKPTAMDYVLVISCFVRYSHSPRFDSKTFCWNKEMISFCARSPIMLVLPSSDINFTTFASSLEYSKGSITPITSIITVVGIIGGIVGCIIGAAFVYGR